VPREALALHCSRPTDHPPTLLFTPTHFALHTHPPRPEREPWDASKDIIPPASSESLDASSYTLTISPKFGPHFVLALHSLSLSWLTCPFSTRLDPQDPGSIPYQTTSHGSRTRGDAVPRGHLRCRLRWVEHQPNVRSLPKCYLRGRRICATCALRSPHYS
jgi:hypothetical protein